MYNGRVKIQTLHGYKKSKADHNMQHDNYYLIAHTHTHLTKQTEIVFFENMLPALIISEYYCPLACDAFSSGKSKPTFQSIQLPQASSSSNKICTAMTGRYSNSGGQSKVQSKDRQVQVDGLGWTGEMCTVKKSRLRGKGRTAAECKIKTGRYRDWDGRGQS
jgi:hypothetical protein